MRYRWNKQTKVIHDTLTACDDAKLAGLAEITFKTFSNLWSLGAANPCNHCFRDDALPAPTPANLPEAPNLGKESPSEQSTNYSQPSGRGRSGHGRSRNPYHTAG